MGTEPTSDPRHFTRRPRTATIALDADGTVLAWSPEAQEWLGYCAGEVLGNPVTSLLAEEPDHARFAARLQGQGGSVGRISLRQQDGSHVQTWLRLDPMPGPTHSARLWLAFVADMEGARHADEGAALLESISESSKIGIFVYGPDLRISFVNSAAQQWAHLPDSQLVGRTLGEVMPSERIAEYENGLRYVLRTGRPIVGARFRSFETTGIIYDDWWTCSIFRLEGRAGEILGIANVMFDISESMRSRGRISLLSRSIKRIGTSLDATQTASEFCGMLTPQVADFVAVDMLEPTGEAHQLNTYASLPNVPMRRIVTRSVQDLITADLSEEGAVTWSPGSPQLEAMHTESPIVLRQLNENTTWYSIDPVSVSELLDLGVHSAMMIPLRTCDLTIGVATLLRWRKPIPFETEDAILVEELACRAATSIENARRYARKHEIAFTLQRRLLPQCIEPHSALEVAYRYLPADASVGVGGDWFDVISLVDNRVALVVGDVTGHGIQAAAAMGRLRATICTLAALNMEPGQLLFQADKVTRMLGEGADDQDVSADAEETCSWGTIGATCLYAIYDPASRHCTIACAGHPAPMFVTPSGHVELPEVATAPPLGMNLLGHPYPSTDLELPLGSMIVLYSDGLIESRDRDIDAGVDILKRGLQNIGADPQRVCDMALRTMMTDAGPLTDDVTVLIARTKATPA
jgi:PAS domain S-box-containing protein